MFCKYISCTDSLFIDTVILLSPIRTIHEHRTVNVARHGRGKILGTAPYSFEKLTKYIKNSPVFCVVTRSTAETSVRNHPTPRNSPEDGKIHFIHCGSTRSSTKNLTIVGYPAKIQTQHFQRRYLSDLFTLEHIPVYI